MKQLFPVTAIAALALAALSLAALSIAALAPAVPAQAEDLAAYALTLKNHRFAPSEIHVPSGRAFFIVVTNEDDAADEFEMSRPAIEKIIPLRDQGQVRIRPLAPGRFVFFGDFHRDTAQGVIVSE